MADFREHRLEVSRAATSSVAESVRLARRDRAGRSGDAGLAGTCIHATLLWLSVNQKLHADRFFSTPEWGFVRGTHAVVTAARSSQSRPESATC